MFSLVLETALHGIVVLNFVAGGQISSCFARTDQRLLDRYPCRALSTMGSEHAAPCLQKYEQDRCPFVTRTGVLYLPSILYAVITMIESFASGLKLCEAAGLGLTGTTGLKLCVVIHLPAPYSKWLGHIAILSLASSPCRCHISQSIPLFSTHT